MKRSRRNTALVSAVILVPYRPLRVAGPPIEGTEVSLSEPVGGLRLRVFNTGANRMSSLLVGSSPPWRTVPAFVIEHPSRGLIVFDLGLSHEVAEKGEQAIAPPVGWLMESRGRPGLTLEAQMREADLSPSDVEYVVISHLHQDHTGVADEFSQAIFVAGDAVVHFDWLESEDVERIASDPERAALLRNQVRSLRDSSELLIIPGHDLRGLVEDRPDLIHHRSERFEPSAWPIGDR